MVNLKVNNINVSVPDGTTILEASKIAGFSIPKLCHLKDLNEIGACKICSIEVEGIDRLVTSCNNIVTEGMSIFTNTQKVREARKINISLILSQHNFQCATCVRNDNCLLQKVATDSGILEIPYKNKFKKEKWNQNFPLIKDAEKCIKCMRCIQVCDKIQSLNVWNLVGTGSRTTVGIKGNCSIEDSNCSLCGQCIVNCPVGALRERNDVDKIFDALNDPNITTIVQIAPAVRTSWAENYPNDETLNINKLVYALKKIGFNYVFDTTFSADLTIMEEANELLKKLNHKETEKLPLFTSCCPGWIRFLKSEFPHMVDNLSSAKSPQQMFGSLAKTYFADKLNLDSKKIFSISIMPCLAKKDECEHDFINEDEKAVDVVITTRELNRILRSEQIIPKELKEAEFDFPAKNTSGSGVIFGSSGGVTEAALRTAYFAITGSNPPPDSFDILRGNNPWKELTIDIENIHLNAAIVNGLGNARKLLESLDKGVVSYDFVEVMACPGGCVCGGGQLIHESIDKFNNRSSILYNIDKNASIRFSHENPDVLKCYEEFLNSPLSHTAHKLLHHKH